MICVRAGIRINSMRDIIAALLAFIAVVALGAILVGMMHSRAFGHDWKRPELDQWYGSLQRPGVLGSSPYGTVSCCSKEDCHETEAELRGNDWWARLGHKIKVAEGQYDWELQDWVKVPAQAVMQKQPNPTGNAVICHQVNLMGGGTQVNPQSPIWCFVPPTES